MRTDLTIGMLSKSRNERNSVMHLALFKRHVRPVFNDFSYPRVIDWKLLCKFTSTCKLAARVYLR